MNTSVKFKRPREIKLYTVKDSNGDSVYVKAKTKAAALNYVVGKHFTVTQVSGKGMVAALNAVANGVEIHEAS